MYLILKAWKKKGTGRLSRTAHENCPKEWGQLTEPPLMGDNPWGDTLP